MNRDETHALLTTLSTVLEKPVPPEAEAVWAELLAGVPLVWAKMAAMDLLATSPWWPKPAEVITRAKALAAAERARQDREAQLALPSPPPPPPPPAQGPELASIVLGEIVRRKKANPGMTLAERREMSRAVVYELRDRLGVAPPRSGLPCVSKTCRCTHTDGCDAGWIDADRGDGVMQAFPCPSCNPRRHTVLTRSGGNRQAALRALRDTSDVKAAEGEAW